MHQNVKQCAMKGRDEEEVALHDCNEENVLVMNVKGTYMPYHGIVIKKQI